MVGDLTPSYGTPATAVSQEKANPYSIQWNVAVALRNADNALVDAVNQVLDGLVADGTVATIFGRYGIPYPPPVTR